jgi:glutamyl-Q tRNA(Asp) synthetase
MLADNPPLPRYRGRFAPSPTGPLHFGSLVAALGSKLDALRHGGEWWVRIEDIDTPRNQLGADLEILRTLEAFGFVWQGEVIWQSQRLEAYQAALDQLIASGTAYPCACSRKEIAEAHPRQAVDGGLVYPGLCRKGLPSGHSPRAWRLRVDSGPNNLPCGFQDRLQGEVIQYLEQDVGDFVLRRADGLFAYQLAVVVDDAWQGMTDVVRGADLIASTPRQIWLQQQLGLPMPRYAHLPVVTNAAGEKLSKQTKAPALDAAQAASLLCQALVFLAPCFDCMPPEDLPHSTVAAVWQWIETEWLASQTLHVP